jgi:hypothetical protein
MAQARMGGVTGGSVTISQQSTGWQELRMHDLGWPTRRRFVTWMGGSAALALGMGSSNPFAQRLLRVVR